MTETASTITNRTPLAGSDPQLGRCLDDFVAALRDLMGERLVSVMLYGSAMFDDLAPGYGDRDFLCRCENNLDGAAVAALIALRAALRTGSNLYAAMLEGAFLPRVMLDPVASGCALWWGTSGERIWRENRLGALVLHVICETGVVIWGQDVRSEIPAPTRDALLDDVRAFCRSAREHGHGGGLHTVDWLLTAARLLLWLREGRLSSKSEAAIWGSIHVRDSWRGLLPRASAVRRRPAWAQTLEMKAWLSSLTESIRAACDELERELALHADASSLAPARESE